MNQTRLSTVIPTRTFGSQEAQGLFLPLGLNLYSSPSDVKETETELERSSGSLCLHRYESQEETEQKRERAKLWEESSSSLLVSEGRR